MNSFNNRSTRLIISFFLGVPSYAVLALIRNFPFSQITLYAYVEYSLAATFCFFLIFELQEVKSKLLNKVIPWSKNWKLRIGSEIFGSFIITTVSVYISYSFLYEVIWDTDIYLPSLYFYISLVFFISLSFMAFVNAIPLIDEWKKSILRAESLEKDHLQAKMEALRTQLSPHFFFNNLSILNGLIYDDPKGAKSFTAKMSDVFRYILSHKNDELVPLSEELNFIADYIFLLETRFKDKFSVKIKIDDKRYLIPPVSLQQLIENAIKHNETSFNRPLEIYVLQEKDFLIIKNIKHPLKTPATSTGLGLENIRQRFEHLTTNRVSYIDNSEIFSIRIPLIPNYESSGN